MTKNKQQKLWIGLMLAMVGMSFYSARAIFVKLAYMEGVSAEVLITWRMLLSLPFYLIIGLIAWQRLVATHQGNAREGNTHDQGVRKMPSRKDILFILLNGLTGYYAASFLDFKGLELISVQLGRLILLTYPIFVVLFGYLFFRYRLSWKMLPPIVICYVGLLIIFSRQLMAQGDIVFLGGFYVLCASISFAFFQLFSRRLVNRVGPTLYTSLAMSSASLAIIIHFLLTHTIADLSISQNVFLLSLAIAFLSTVLPSYLMNTAISMVEADKVSMVGNLGPVITIALAVFILGETFTWREGVGALMVISGIFLFSRLENREV